MKRDLTLYRLWIGILGKERQQDTRNPCIPHAFLSTKAGLYSKSSRLSHLLPGNGVLGFQKLTKTEKGLLLPTFHKSISNGSNQFWLEEDLYLKKLAMFSRRGVCMDFFRHCLGRKREEWYQLELNNIESGLSHSIRRHHDI